MYKLAVHSKTAFSLTYLPLNTNIFMAGHVYLKIPADSEYLLHSGTIKCNFHL